MNGKIANGALILVVAIFLTILAINVRIGATIDSVALLNISGMTCDACATGISQALQSLDGVAATEVDVPRGMATVGYNAKTVTPEALAEQVRRLGFASRVDSVLTPARYKQATGRDITKNSISSKGGCSSCAEKPALGR